MLSIERVVYVFNIAYLSGQVWPSQVKLIRKNEENHKNVLSHGGYNLGKVKLNQVCMNIGKNKNKIKCIVYFLKKIKQNTKLTWCLACCCVHTSQENR